MNYYQVSVRYSKTLDTGKIKKVTEQYLFCCVSFTDAERQATQILSPYMSSEYSITAIKIVSYEEVLKSKKDEDDKYYKCTYHTTAINERTLREEITRSSVLIQSSGVEAAHKYFLDYIAGWICDVTLESIDETPIMDFYPYQ